jgi:hypothetical protein
VRASGTEIGRALQLDRGRGDGALEQLQARQPLLAGKVGVAEAAQPRDHRACHDRRRQLAVARQQRRAGFVALADDHRAFRCIEVVEDPHQLVLDEAALLLDDENVLEPFGETPRAGFFQRPGQRDLVDAQPQLPRDVVGDPEIRQRLAQIEIGLAGGEDAEPRRAAVEHDAVELVGAGEGGDGLHFGPVQPALLRKRRIRPAHPQPVRRRRKIIRRHDLDPGRIAEDRRRAFDCFGDGLEADPAAGITR